MAWVVRGGVSTPDALIKGYRLHLGVPGLYGFSVQYAPEKSVDELARAGGFPHTNISVATSDALTSALHPLGFQIRLVSSPGQGFHHTLAVVYDLSGAFQHQPNPRRAR